jgi:hypothetical protein
MATSSAAQASFDGTPQSCRLKRKIKHVGGQTQDLGGQEIPSAYEGAGQPSKKELVTKVFGLESHTFDIGM